MWRWQYSWCCRSIRSSPIWSDRECPSGNARRPESTLAEEPTADSTLHRILVKSPVRYTRRGQPRGCLVASGDAGTDDEDIQAWLMKVRDQTTRELTRKIDADITEGALPASTDSGGLAGFVMALLSGLAQRAREGVPCRELERIVHIAAAAVRRHQRPQHARRQIDTGVGFFAGLQAVGRNLDEV